MLAIVTLTTVTLAGLVAVGLLARRAVGEARRLSAQVRTTSGELEPRYRTLRVARDAARVREGVREIAGSGGRTIDGAGGAGERG